MVSRFSRRNCRLGKTVGGFVVKLDPGVTESSSLRSRHSDGDMTATFFRDRGPSLALVILIMFAISLGQTGISYTMAFGALSALLPRDRSGIATSLVILRFGLVALMAVLWALRRKHALFRLIVIANALFTMALLIQTSSLISALFGGASEAVNALMLDVVLMATSNILIFSAWYWLIDPPGIEADSRADEPWDFLFPQRSGSLPRHGDSTNARAFDRHGLRVKRLGLIGYLKKQAELENPSAFMTGLSKLLPSMLEGNPDAPLIVERVYYTREAD